MAQSIVVRGNFLPWARAALWGPCCSILLVVSGLACGIDHPTGGRRSAPTSPPDGTDARTRLTPGARDAGRSIPDAADAEAEASTEAPSQALTAQQVAGALYVADSEAAEALAGCATGSTPERGRCLIRARYVDDAAASDLALRLYEVAGSVAGLEPEHDMDGGWRGQLHLVPELPIRGHRRQLAWVVAAAEDHERFFVGLREAGRDASRAPSKISFRHRDLGVHFFRSVGRTTPSAYASGWRVAYNVSGSLHKTEVAVSETLFHEIFHLNDADHGDWSRRALTPLFDGVVARCGTNIACLSPYAPNHTLVRGGTYYAFQPGNGVWEYSAELAIRYFREQRRQLGLPTIASTEKAFKCGPEENGRAWQLIVDEFFGGVDLVPPC